MSFLEALLDGSNAKERQKKHICAIAIAITAILLVVALIAFAICQIVDATANNNSDEEKDTVEETVDLGETTAKQLSETAIYSGNLLTLNDNNHYKGEPELINIESERKANGAFISLFSKKTVFEATPDTVKALCDLVNACNKALNNDDNLVLSNAYDTSAISTQSGLYSSGEAVAFSCCFEGSTSDIRPINEVEKYKWIYSNAHKYGFVAVSAKSNVFRYVGVTHATAAKTKGLYLDNYLKQLKNATIDSPVTLNVNGNIIAYTCPISDVKVPNNYKYDISGNNVDGVIVTVYLSGSINNSEG
jgi:D-alanyl-D-alanine carboxypeptidase